MKLFTESSAKIDKSQTEEYLNIVLYLEPSVDYRKICPSSTPACRKSCLTKSGRMAMESSVNARVRRTNFYLNDKSLFMKQIREELDTYIRRATKAGKRLVVRLNGTSDLDWDEIYNDYSDKVIFYEYFKEEHRSDVHYTFSRSEKTTLKEVKEKLRNKINVAVVFEDVPKTWEGMEVINGDLHDRRFEDKEGVIVGLKLKGHNKEKVEALKSGFAIRKVTK